VKKYSALFLSLLVSPLCSVAADKQEKEYSFGEFKKEVNEAQRVKSYEESILKVDDLYTLFPNVETEEDKAKKKYLKELADIEAKKKKANNKAAVVHAKPELSKDVVIAKPVPDKTKSDKEDAAATAKNKTSKKTATSTKNKTHSNGASNLYFPPSAKKNIPLNTTNIQLGGSDFKQSKTIFGIPIGTRIEVKLRGNASSVQKSYIQFVTLQRIKGKLRDLPKGSILFGRTSAVKGSNRLFSTVVQGITPDAFEFDNIKGVAFNKLNEAGLDGRIINDGKVLERSVNIGGLAVGSALVSNLAGNSIIGGASSKGLNNIISEANRESKAKNGSPAFIVKALPQTGYIYIERTF